MTRPSIYTELLQAGNLDELFTQIRKRFWCIAYQITRSPLFADDAIQDASLGIWRCIDNLPPTNAQICMYFRAAVAHAAVAVVKRHKRYAERWAPLGDMDIRLNTSTLDVLRESARWALLRAAVQSDHAALIETIPRSQGRMNACRRRAQKLVVARGKELVSSGNWMLAEG